MQQISLQPLKNYNGSDPPKVRAFEQDMADADKISKYINTELAARQGGKSVKITYAKIATGTGIAERRVHQYCMQIPEHSDNAIELAADE